jgi:ERCC4-related helicase
MIIDGVIEDRDYQRRFVERALEANTLAVLPTALGKTVIAELWPQSYCTGIRGVGYSLWLLQSP